MSFVNKSTLQLMFFEQYFKCIRTVHCGFWHGTRFCVSDLCMMFELLQLVVRYLFQHATHKTNKL